MVVYKMDLKLIFNEESAQNIFISNMDSPDIVWDEVQQEHCLAVQTLLINTRMGILKYSWSTF